MRQLFSERVDTKWFVFEVTVDKSLKTCARFCGLSPHVPRRWHGELRCLVDHNITGSAKLMPTDIFNFETGKRLAIKRAIEKIQMKILKDSARLDALYIATTVAHVATS